MLLMMIILGSTKPRAVLVGGFNPTPLKNDGVAQLGFVKFPTEWKFIKFHGSSHHQPLCLYAGYTRADP